MTYLQISSENQTKSKMKMIFPDMMLTDLSPTLSSVLEYPLNLLVYGQNSHLINLTTYRYFHQKMLTKLIK